LRHKPTLTRDAKKVKRRQGVTVREGVDGGDNFDGKCGLGA
jgi:hypothetical protein